MRVGVVADVVTCRVDLLDIVRISPYPDSDEEERRLDVVFVECVEQALSLVVAPGGVEAESDLFLLRPDVADRDRLAYAVRINVLVADGSFLAAGAVVRFRLGRIFLRVALRLAALLRLL